MEIRKNYSLKAFNTFSINVDAKYFARVASVDDLLIARDFIEKNDCKAMVLGGGSNILFLSDYDGLILRNELKGIKVEFEDEEHVHIRAMAGENWDDFVSWCVKKNYGGLENLSLIPGSVGASPIQNIGAYGVEIKDMFLELEAFNLKTGELKNWKKNDCCFGYRDSVFKHKYKGEYIILSVSFKLDKKPVFKTAYGAIQNEIERMGSIPISIAAIRKAVISIRRAKLPDPEKIGNAGSFFKNPTISEAQFQQLKSKFPEIVSYQLPNGNYKLAAGWLIDRAGWKGKRLGDAGVHNKQALVLVNYGNAAGEDIIQLAHEIEESIKFLFQINLECEVNVIGNP